MTNSFKINFRNKLYESNKEASMGKGGGRPAELQNENIDGSQ